MIVVELPGDPVPKGRPRFRAVSTRDGRSFINTYTPAKTRAAEKSLAWAAKIAMRGKAPLAGPLRVSVTASLAIPASWSNKKRDAALAGILRPVSRPDGDNYQKLAWDALNSIVWLDDAQIVDARIIKVYAEQPSLRIEVDPLDAALIASDSLSAAARP